MGDFRKYVRPGQVEVSLTDLRRGEQETAGRRNEALMKHAEMIRFNRGRGMSRKRLVESYGEQAVLMAIGTGEQS